MITRTGTPPQTTGDHQWRHFVAANFVCIGGTFFKNSKTDFEYSNQELEHASQKNFFDEMRIFSGFEQLLVISEGCLNDPGRVKGVFRHSVS